MDFMTLNGLVLPIAVNSSDRDDLEIGEGLSRAFDGSVQRSVRAYKRQWSLQTAPTLPEISQAFVALLQGRGQHWSFDTDLYSDQGLGASAQNHAGPVGGGRYGGALKLDSNTGNITYQGLSGPPGATILIQRQASPTLWNDYALTWDASGTLTHVYKDGVAQATTLPVDGTVHWIAYTFSTGALALSNVGGGDQLFDELVSWPFEAPESWLVPLATWRASHAWSFGPTLIMSGTLGDAVVQGKPGKSKQQVGVVGGTAYDNLESFSFDLWEA